MTISFRRHFQQALPRVETARLVLRPVGDGDEAAVADFFNIDGRIFPREYYAHACITEWPFDVARIRAEVDPQMRNAANYTSYPLYAFRRADGAIVGMIHFSKDRFDRTRVHYFITPSERRKGYAAEAYAACVNAAVGAGLITRPLHAQTYPGNTVSKAFLTHAGFACHGEKNVIDQPGGHPYTAVIFSRDMAPDRPVRFARQGETEPAP